MIYILIPIFNEAANITGLYNEIKNVLPDEEKFYVFSDDGSTDGSREILSDVFRELPHIVLGDKKNYGPGNAFNVGFEWILKNSKANSDVVVTMEADCTSDIRILPDMLIINRLGYNLVLASVYAQGGGFNKTSFFRKVLSAVANIGLRLFFDLKVLTLSSFYRVYTVELLRKIRESHERIVTEKGFICMVEVLIKAIDAKAKIIEVPMLLNSGKRVGKSKMKVMKTTLAYIAFMFRWKIYGKK